MNTMLTTALSTAKGPKYKALADRIRAAVEAGDLAAGAKLPPVRELAYQLEITPGTVARAYKVLTDEGVLQAEVGRGTFVAERLTPIQDDVWARQESKLVARDPGSVSLFSPRLPDVGQVQAIRAALRKVADADPELFLNYPTRDAYRPVREAVVNWMSDLPLGPVDQHDVVLTHGGQNGLCVVFQTILRGPQPAVLVEDLSYSGFRRAAELMRASVIGVAMDKHGMLPEALEQAARKSAAQLVCLSPEVQNPTGAHMPLERRKALIEVARQHDLQIIDDDCYAFGEARGPSLRALAPDITWHVSSLSKSFTPALRIGFALAPLDRGADLRRVSEYGYFGLSQPLAELARLLLSDPATRELAGRVRARMDDYVRVAVNVLGKFDLTWGASVPFLWLRLPPGWRAAGFSRAAERDGVQVRTADEFALRDGRAPHAVRIAVNAQVPLATFEDAMQRLRALLDNPPEQISV